MVFADSPLLPRRSPDFFPATASATNGAAKDVGGGEFTFSANALGPGRVPCINCGTLETPLWRRTPEGNPICNACGLYQKSRNMPRPSSLAPSGSPTSAHPPSGAGASNAHPGANANGQQAPAGEGKINALACGNCGTSTTPLWRRDDVGNNICNACGLYFKLHGTHRPTSMKKTVIKRRKR
ncbi:hypothetical protein B0H10DRAFT_1789920, partial [Mycena sp. CBHHK59/15]